MTYRPFTVNEGTGEIGEFPHFQLFTNHDWGMIIYDEVHLLPAPVFRVTAEIQARRRLGLTATLVREDGREEDVFSLIGPKKYDVPWKELEQQGWIATAICTEVRVKLPPSVRLEYVMTEDSRIKYRIAAENLLKLPILRHLLDQHRDDNVLIIGQYLDQLQEIADFVDAPLITGKTPNQERAELYEAFRTGRIKRLVVSKVANFAIDLPDANVAIQVSGTFGSRQEEAQRLGRILRPKTDGAPAHFYSLVTRDSKDQDFSANRQLFLTEQGYRYDITDAEELVPGLSATLAEEQAILDTQGADALAEWVAAKRGRRSLAAPLLGDDTEGTAAEPPKKRRGRPPKARPAATDTTPFVPDEPQAANGNGHHASENATTRRDRSHLRLIK
jgi:DNA excision repair protein ERCC-3